MRDLQLYVDIPGSCTRSLTLKGRFRSQNEAQKLQPVPRTSTLRPHKLQKKTAKQVSTAWIF